MPIPLWQEVYQNAPARMKDAVALLDLASRCPPSDPVEHDAYHQAAVMWVILFLRRLGLQEDDLQLAIEIVNGQHLAQ